MFKVLFINHNSNQCGIYQFGYNIGKVLLKNNNKKYCYFYSAVGNESEFDSVIANVSPDLVVVNFTPSKFSWLRSYLPKNKDIKFGSIVHEWTLEKHKSYFKNYFFDINFYANPTVKETKNNYPLPRLIPDPPTELFVDDGNLRVGCFGFGMIDRGWLQAIDLIQSQYDKAHLSFHMPYNTVVDPGGKSHANATAKQCLKKPLKPGITLSISHDFLDTIGIVNKLGQNTINLFLYQEKNKKGISSSTDFALASRRPFGISSSPMFDHFQDIKHLICVETNSVNDIINRGTAPLIPYYERWSDIGFLKDFERMLDCIFGDVS